MACCSEGVSLENVVMPPPGLQHRMHALAVFGLMLDPETCRYLRHDFPIRRILDCAINRTDCMGLGLMLLVLSSTSNAVMVRVRTDP